MPEKPLTLDAICLMELKDIEKTFPYGALVQKTKGKQERFRPAEADQKPDRTLPWLRAEKRKRMAPFRLLGKTHGYTTNPAHALRTVPDVGEAVDEVTQRELTQAARERIVEKPLWEALRELEQSGLSERQAKSIQRPLYVA